MKRFTICDDVGTPYLTRYTLAEVRGVALRLHHFHRPDGDQCCHDHPWWFASLILRGGYVEEFPDGRTQTNRAGRVLWRPIGFAHRVARLLSPDTWTLVLTGPKASEWGFLTRHGWVRWRDFLALGPRRAAWCEHAPREAVRASTPDGAA